MPSTRASLDSSTKSTKTSKATTSKATKSTSPEVTKSTPTTAPSTVASKNTTSATADAARIDNLENEVANLKEQISLLSTAPTIQGVSNPVESNEALIRMIYDWFRLQDNEMVRTEFNSRHGEFLKSSAS